MNACLAREFESVLAKVRPELVAVGVLRQSFEREKPCGELLVVIGLRLRCGPTPGARCAQRRRSDIDGRREQQPARGDDHPFTATRPRIGVIRHRLHDLMGRGQHRVRLLCGRSLEHDPL